MTGQTDEKQAEGHMFTCRCGETVIGHECSHCDRPCPNKRCKKCRGLRDKDMQKHYKEGER